MKTAPWKKRAFQLLAEGLSVPEIVERLKLEGVKTNSGEFPTRAYVHNICFMERESERGAKREKENQRSFLIQLLELLEKGKLKEAKQRLFSALKEE